MRKILDIAINDLRVFFREPGVLVGLVVIPLIMTFAIGYGLGQGGNGPQQVRVDVIDHDNSARSQQFLTEVRAINNTLVLCPMDDRDGICQLGDDPALDTTRAVERLASNTALALIEIPEGFGDLIESGQPSSITYRSNENASAPSFILQAVQAAAQRINGAQVAAEVGLSVAEAFPPVGFTDDADRTTFRQSVYDRATALWADNPVGVDYRQSSAPDAPTVSGTQAGFGQSVPGMGSMFVMFTVMTALYSLIRERRNWTLQRMVMMPVSRSQILAGKILMWFTAGMIQYGVVFVIGLLMGLNFGNDLLGVLVVMVSFTLCITALTFTIDTFVKTDAQANSVSLLLALTLAPLGGAWWPLDIVPEFMRTIGHISPVAWAMDGFNKLLFEQGTLMMVLPSVGVLLALTAVFFVIAVRRFKYD